MTHPNWTVEHVEPMLGIDCELRHMSCIQPATERVEIRMIEEDRHEDRLYGPTHQVVYTCARHVPDAVRMVRHTVKAQREDRSWELENKPRRTRAEEEELEWLHRDLPAARVLPPTEDGPW